MINGSDFITGGIRSENLTVAPNTHYMVINKAEHEFQVHYNYDISNHPIVYNPYKYTDQVKQKIDPKAFQSSHEVPEGYKDILAKWYSIKFTYSEFNLIFIKPEMGISFQIHRVRTEYWEILGGKPIVLNGNKVYYYVESGTHFKNPIGAYHSIINPNNQDGEYVILKERWGGHFDEKDIKRVYNPNRYSDE